MTSDGDVELIKLGVNFGEFSGKKLINEVTVRLG